MIGRLLFSFGCCFGVFAASFFAHAACENGMEERLIRRAITQTGTITYQVFKRPALYRERVFPAMSVIMTQAEYDALPKPSVYMRKVSVPEKLKTTTIDLPIGTIEEFDYVYWPGGTTATRKTKETFLKSVENDEVLEPAKTDYIETEFERPEPIRLSDGRLRVFISPEYKLPLTVPGQINVVSRTYVKSRTPAKYQLSFCEN